MVLYESPHKILKTLKQLAEVLGSDRAACIAREISKLHEEFIRGSLIEILQNLEQRSKIKGEITLVVAGRGG
jgi:Predicted methyltransferases